MNNIVSLLAKELQIREKQVENTIKLIDEGNTIPFITRYRKEVTGGLNDSILRELDSKLKLLRNLENRKREVLESIKSQGKLTEELNNRIQNAQTMTELDDIYRPYRPKRRTRSVIAKEKGLEPLAEIIWGQKLELDNIWELSKNFINSELEVETEDQAVNFALDIIAEKVSDNADYRKIVREYTLHNGVLETKATRQEASVYEMYYDYSETLKHIPPHCILAINRGEAEKFLSVRIRVNEEKIIHLLCSSIIVNNSVCSELLKKAIVDSYKRLIAPSIEREIRNQLTEKAEQQAVKVFGKNLRNLLLQKPAYGKVVMGVDPGFRTGNKIAVVDETGKVLAATVVYMTLPEHDKFQAKLQLKKYIKDYNVDLIALGNGTASRESEIIIAEICRELNKKIQYIIVNEAGASIYSASRLASEELSDYDATLRSAVSLARRIQDPLAELVKIEPKSIGVGQYQHDINQKLLSETLRGVVEDCVNSVGVDLNTASPSLLQYVSGVTSVIANNIVAYRQANGKFSNRSQLLKVNKLGPKTFRQCAGFLRIANGDNILDNTAVHPESYDVVLKMLELIGESSLTIQEDTLKKLAAEADNWDLKKIADKLNIGLLTLMDIISELKKPGRDPRDELSESVFRTHIVKIEDLKPNMVLRGTVRNVVDFGAFIDIGVGQDGLIHISQLSDKFVKHPMDVLQVGEVITVKVIEVDIERNRISLTMKDI